MSKTGSSSGADQNASGDAESIETFKRRIEAMESKNSELLGENRKLKDKYSETQSALEAHSKKELEAQGKFQELAGNYQKENETLKKQLEEKEKSYGWNVVSSAIKNVAVQNGCLAPDDFLKALEKTDLEKIKVGKNYEVDASTVSGLIGELKTKKGYFFKSDAVTVKDVAPVDNSKNEKPKTLDALKREDIETMLKKGQYKK
jgi:predicted nuclease with TOPRIM domain